MTTWSQLVLLRFDLKSLMMTKISHFQANLYSINLLIYIQVNSICKTIKVNLSNRTRRLSAKFTISQKQVVRHFYAFNMIKR